MGILLETPFNPGDMDPGNEYTHARIVQKDENTENEFVRVGFRLGYYQSNAWRWAIPAVKPKVLMVRDEPDLPDPEDKAKTKKGDKKFNTMVSRKVQSSDVGKTAQEVNDRYLYQAAIDAGLFSGSVE